MAEIVNLNRFRKQKARTEKNARAEENRARHGRSKSEKKRDRDDAAKRAALLNGARIDDADTDKNKCD